jgi:hypothetical protein
MRGVQRDWRGRWKILLPLLLTLFSFPAHGQNSTRLGSLEARDLAAITSQPSATLGRAALAINPSQWKHAETEHFVYHYANSYVATPVSVEAEAYYRVISQDFADAPPALEAKCHIYIFEEPAEWAQFKLAAELDPWSGGIHLNNELFLLRDPSYKFKGPVLAHEVAHLVVARFFPGRIPLWLSEGYAEYAASRAYASFHRARGYTSKPVADPVDPASYIPLQTLTTMQTYPANTEVVGAFYNQSHRLVRFLAQDKNRFLQFLKASSGPAPEQFEAALLRLYGQKYPTLSALEEEFKPYATK